MTQSYWKTRGPSPRRHGTARPLKSRILRQLAVALLIGIVGSAILAGCSSEAETPPEASVTAVAESVAAPATPTRTATPPPDASTPTIAAATPTTAAISTSTAEPSRVPTGTPSPTPLATATSPAPTDTPTAVPTETSAPTDTPAPEADAVSFANDVLPILQNRCVNCHGGEKTNAGLVLKTYAELLAGSENGAVIVPGNSAESYLVELITAGKMPKRGPRLLPAEISLITAWIDAGALDN